jgi:large subunit ribosomal protein L12
VLVLEYVYSALLLHSAGQKINEENIKKVLAASGSKVDEAKVKALVSVLEGVNIDEVIKQSAMPVAVAAPTASAAKVEEKKEEKKPEEEAKKSEEAAAGLASLFG